MHTAPAPSGTNTLLRLLSLSGDVCVSQNQLPREQSTKYYNQFQFHADIEINVEVTNNNVNFMFFDRTSLIQ